MIHTLLEATHDLLFRIRKALSEEKKKKKIVIYATDFVFC